MRELLPVDSAWLVIKKGGGGAAGLRGEDEMGILRMVFVIFVYGTITTVLDTYILL